VNARALLMALAMLAPACVKIHDFNGGAGSDGGGGSDGGDSGSTDPCRSGTNACLYEVGGKLHAEVYGRYNLTFSNEGFHFPESLSSGAFELLGAPPAACSAEMGVGVAYSPATVISSVASASTGSSVDSVMTTQMIPGPGVAKVAIDWQATLANCTSSPSGRSSFTFFPDGRITRMDIVHTGSSEIDAATCSCSGQVGSSWELSTYWSFALNAINTGNVDGIGAIPTNNGENKAVNQIVCMEGPSHRLGLASVVDMPMNRVRRMGADDFALMTDMLYPATMDPLPADMMYESSTTMYITTSATETCPTVDTYLTPFSMDYQLWLTDASSSYSRGLPDDGIYGGEFGGMEGTGGISFDGPQLTIEPYNGVTIPAFALWLNANEITSITRTPVSSSATWYTDQPITSATQHILWFPDGLAPGEKIVIEVGS
jgi:hypothetical protein